MYKPLSFNNLKENEVNFHASTLDKVWPFSDLSPIKPESYRTVYVQVPNEHCEPYIVFLTDNCITVGSFPIALNGNLGNPIPEPTPHESGVVAVA